MYSDFGLGLDSSFGGVSPSLGQRTFVRCGGILMKDTRKNSRKKDNGSNENGKYSALPERVNHSVAFGGGQGSHGW